MAPFISTAPVLLRSLYQARGGMGRRGRKEEEGQKEGKRGDLLQWEVIGKGAERGRERRQWELAKKEMESCVYRDNQRKQQPPVHLFIREITLTGKEEPIWSRSRSRGTEQGKGKGERKFKKWRRKTALHDMEDNEMHLSSDKTWPTCLTGGDDSTTACAQGKSSSRSMFSFRWAQGKKLTRARMRWDLLASGAADEGVGLVVEKGENKTELLESCGADLPGSTGHMGTFRACGRQHTCTADNGKTLL
ncbi:unnamed protein product [Pleuronectes platessa]|uniref:Uncharacterized protein n=1 Tax=Pleuronectes platessa TaxID=8262 RepID=A0A9N7TU32_PLEPL|nr:unnamed protein product [Pleuronectes platessa]